MEPITQLPEIIGGIGGTYKDYDGTMKTIPSNSVLKLSTYVTFQWLQKDLKYRIDKCTADSGPVNTVSVKLVENGCPRFGWVSVTKKYDGVSFPIFSFIKGNVPQTNFHLVCELLICGVESDDLCQDNITCDKNKEKYGNDLLFEKLYEKSSNLSILNSTSTITPTVSEQRRKRSIGEQDIMMSQTNLLHVKVDGDAFVVRTYNSEDSAKMIISKDIADEYKEDFFVVEKFQNTPKTKATNQNTIAINSSQKNHFRELTSLMSIFLFLLF